MSAAEIKARGFGRVAAIGRTMVILVALTLVSCVRCVDLRVFNASGEVLKIVNYYPTTEDEGTIANGKSMLLPFGLDNWRVTKGNTAWSYNYYSLKWPGPEYVSDNWFQCLHVVAQIEPDGSIWILPPGTTGIVQSMPPQPPGYPARPDPMKTR